MYYGNAPSFNDVDRTSGAFDAPPQGHHIHDSENVLTLDQLHHTMHGKGNGAPGAGRNHSSRLVFGSIGNTSRLVSEANARKRGGSGGSDEAKLRTQSRRDSADKQRTTTSPGGGVHLVSGGSARSGMTARTVGGVSNDGMDWDPTGDEAAAMQAAAARRRVAAAPVHHINQHHHQPHGGSPRTPVVESPATPAATADDDDDDATPTPQPGALTIQRMNFHRHHSRDGLTPGGFNDEMEEQHRAQQHAVMHEGSLARLLLWRDPTQTAIFFGAGVAALVAARAPGLVAEHLPVNPVVVVAYAAMAFLCRAYLMAMAFPRRDHGLAVDVDDAAAFARACATSINALTYAHADLLSGRDNKAVLRAFLSLYAVAQLGGLLNSTWMVVVVLWGTAFTVPYAVEMKRDAVRALREWCVAEIGGRWSALSSNKRWGSCAATTAAVFLASPTYVRLVLSFVVLVAFRLYRETHVKQMESIERVVRDAGRRLSRAGSEFHAMVGSPGQLFYRHRRRHHHRAVESSRSRGPSTLGRDANSNNSGVSWN